MQINNRLDVNGSDDKPFPQERNFVMRPDALVDNVGPGRTVVPNDMGGARPNHFGQVKYARREGAVSIYKDATRNSANDDEATAKAEGSSIFEPDNENEESQDA